MYGFKAHRVQARRLFPSINIDLLDLDVEEDLTEVEVSYVASRAKVEATIPSTPTEAEVSEEPLHDVTKELTIKAAPNQGAHEA